MSTSVEICNLALDNLGVINKITALADATKEGRACSRWYAIARDACLREYPWPFAERYMDLPEAALTDVELAAEFPIALPTVKNPIWDRVFWLPDDFLKARRIAYPNIRNPLKPYPYQIVKAQVSNEYILVTTLEAAECVLIYTGRHDTDVLTGLMPADFVYALSWRLASMLVTPLALEKALVKEAAAMYRATVLEAFAASAQENQADPQPESEITTCRG